MIQQKRNFIVNNKKYQLCHPCFQLELIFSDLQSTLTNVIIVLICKLYSYVWFLPFLMAIPHILLSDRCCSVLIRFQVICIQGSTKKNLIQDPNTDANSIPYSITKLNTWRLHPDELLGLSQEDKTKCQRGK